MNRWPSTVAQGVEAINQRSVDETLYSWGSRSHRNIIMTQACHFFLQWEWKGCYGPRGDIPREGVQLHIALPHWAETHTYFCLTRYLSVALLTSIRQTVVSHRSWSKFRLPSTRYHQQWKLKCFSGWSSTCAFPNLNKFSQFFRITLKMAAVAAAQKNREMFAIKKSYSIEVSLCLILSC